MTIYILIKKMSIKILKYLYTSLLLEFRIETG